MAQQPISLHAPVGDDGDVSVGDFIEDKTAENPSDVTSYSLLKEKLGDVLTSLTERERKILEMRFGLVDGYERTLEEIGKMYNVTRERIRQIEAKALRKLRHPTRVRHLQGFLDTRRTSRLAVAMQSDTLFPLTPALSLRERIPRTNSRFAPLNLVGTRSTASLTFDNYRDAVERVPTIPRRFRGRGRFRRLGNITEQCSFASAANGSPSPQGRGLG